MTTSEAERSAMRRALSLAVTPGVPLGPNPRVGCVLLAPDGTTIAEGFHRRAGSPHAEVEALTAAGGAARGATAIVDAAVSAGTRDDATAAVVELVPVGIDADTGQMPVLAPA